MMNDELERMTSHCLYVHHSAWLYLAPVCVVSGSQRLDVA